MDIPQVQIEFLMDLKYVEIYVNLRYLAYIK